MYSGISGYLHPQPNHNFARSCNCATICEPYCFPTESECSQSTRSTFHRRVSLIEVCNPKAGNSTGADLIQREKPSIVEFRERVAASLPRNIPGIIHRNSRPQHFALSAPGSSASGLLPPHNVPGHSCQSADVIFPTTVRRGAMIAHGDEIHSGHFCCSEVLTSSRTSSKDLTDDEGLSIMRLHRSNLRKLSNIATTDLHIRMPMVGSRRVCDPYRVESASVGFLDPSTPFEWMRRQSYPSVQNSGKTRTKDKYRMVYTEIQKMELEKEFLYNQYITTQRKAELAVTIGLTDRQVKIWFQNRRAKDRKQKRKE